LDSGFELDELDVWSSIGGGGVSPDYRKPVEDYKDNRRRDNDDDVDGEDLEEGGDWVPPNEFLARQFARTRIASFSVHEGFGRTLKGRDLSRVRNAIWAKTGFQD
ncbi:hypothetical protein RJ640_001214, partial [Escallonia rubra]